MDKPDFFTLAQISFTLFLLHYMKTKELDIITKPYGHVKLQLENSAYSFPHLRGQVNWERSQSSHVADFNTGTFPH